MNKQQKIGILAKKKQAKHLQSITRYYAAQYAVGGVNNDFCQGMCEALKILSDIDDELEMQYWINRAIANNNDLKNRQKNED